MINYMKHEFSFLIPRMGIVDPSDGRRTGPHHARRNASKGCPQMSDPSRDVEPEPRAKH
jgi:hypothetical protein